MDICTYLFEPNNPFLCLFFIVGGDVGDVGDGDGVDAGDGRDAFDVNYSRIYNNTNVTKDDNCNINFRYLYMLIVWSAVNTCLTTSDKASGTYFSQIIQFLLGKTGRLMY